MSGDAATLSENNVQCDSQINSKTTSSVSGDIRTIDGLDGTHTNEDKVKIKLIIQSLSALDVNRVVLLIMGVMVTQGRIWELQDLEQLTYLEEMSQ